MVRKKRNRTKKGKGPKANGQQHTQQEKKIDRNVETPTLSQLKPRPCVSADEETEAHPTTCREQSNSMLNHRSFKTRPARKEDEPNEHDNIGSLQKGIRAKESMNESLCLDDTTWIRENLQKVTLGVLKHAAKRKDKQEPNDQTRATAMTRLSSKNMNTPNQSYLSSEPPHPISGSQGAIAAQTSLTMLLQTLHKDDANSSDGSDSSSSSPPPPQLAKNNVWNDDDSTDSSSCYPTKVNVPGGCHSKMPGLIERDRANYASDTDSDWENYSYTQVNVPGGCHSEMPGLLERDRAKYRSDTDSDWSNMPKEMDGAKHRSDTDSDWEH